MAEVGAQKERWDKLEHNKEVHSVVASPTFEERLRAQWCELPRATRWKVIGGVTMVFNSLAAQVFLVWLYAYMRGAKQPLLFPYLSGWPLDAWIALIRLSLDDARHTQAVNILALNVLAWTLWTAWVLWCGTHRKKAGVF